MLLCYSYCKGICCGCHIEAWHTTVRTELKRTSCGSEVAKTGISCYDASADSCMWNVRGTCCRGKEGCHHACVHSLQDLIYSFLKTFPQWPHTSWAFTVHEYLPGSRLLLCANNLLHVSHLKGFIFRWTLFVWECRSSDMVNFLSHCEQGKRGPSSSLWCCFLWRTRFLFCTYDFPHSGQRCRSTGTYFCGVEAMNGWPVVSTSTSAETPITLPSVTADISICNDMESSDLVSNLSGVT